MRYVPSSASQACIVFPARLDVAYSQRSVWELLWCYAGCPRAADRDTDQRRDTNKIVDHIHVTARPSCLSVCLVSTAFSDPG
eukprot:6199310-Pleurochrysis_carterae.AAC.2